MALGQRPTAYDLMELSINAESSTEDRLFYAKALLERGGGGDERLALKHLEAAVTESEAVSDELLDTYFRVAIEIGDYASIARVLARADTPNSAFQTLEKTFPLLKNVTFLGVAALSLGDAISLALRSELVTEKARQVLEGTRKTVEAGLNRIGTV